MTDWKDLVTQKQEELSKAIPDEWRIPENLRADAQTGPRKGRMIEQQVVLKSNVLSPVELEITERYTAAELLGKIHDRQLKAVEVAIAFAKRAAVAQQLTSCLTEMFFEEGIERARWLDAYLARNNKVYGPLHGLPISLKDSLRLKGMHATTGFVALLKERSTTNSPLVDLLLDAGAVLFVKSNVPQTMMTADSENNIFGRTLNPHNIALTAGGSSGGEGALIALRGSPLGVGTDIAGSIRIPALACGVYGFKPTPDRIPFSGQVGGPKLHLPSLEPVAGPMGHSIADLEMFMRVVLSQQPWRYDAEAVAVGWRVEVCAQPRRRLVVGMLHEDPAYPLHPPVQRTLDAAAAALQKAGHRVVRLENNAEREVSLGMRIAFEYFGLGGVEGRTHLMDETGEPMIKSVATMSHPFVLQPPVIPPDLGLLERLDRLNRARAAYSDAWQRTFVEKGLDVVLAPGSQNTAVAHDTWGLPPYTVMWNTVNYPACIIPLGKASKELDPKPVKYGVPFQPDYDPDEVDGMPCAVQVVAPRFHDEECLWAAGIIDQDLKAK